MQLGISYIYYKNNVSIHLDSARRSDKISHERGERVKRLATAKISVTDETDKRRSVAAYPKRSFRDEQEHHLEGRISV